MWDYYRLPYALVRHNSQEGIYQCWNQTNGGWFVPQDLDRLRRAVTEEGQSIDERVVEAAINSFQKNPKG